MWFSGEHGGTILSLLSLIKLLKFLKSEPCFSRFTFSGSFPSVITKVSPLQTLSSFRVAFCRKRKHRVPVSPQLPFSPGSREAEMDSNKLLLLPDLGLPLLHSTSQAFSNASCHLPKPKKHIKLVNNANAGKYYKTLTKCQGSFFFCSLFLFAF